METSKKKKIILFGVGITALGVLGYLGWQRFYKDKSSTSSNEDNTNDSILPSFDSFTPVKQSSAPKTQVHSKAKPILKSIAEKPKTNDNFPLALGSKGYKVTALQKALIVKYSAKILPKFGADGMFGKELEDALISKGLPKVVDENLYNVLVKARTFDARNIAQNLHNYIFNRKIEPVLTNLKKMRNTDDYNAVNDNFMQMIFEGARNTLVTALMKKFTGGNKQKIQLQLLRMGLKFDGEKWSLSGVELPKKVVTVEPSQIWKDAKTYLVVPANIFLGYEIANRNGFTLFESPHNQKFLIKNTSIKYI
jgi:hypothetical protein